LETRGLGEQDKRMFIKDAISDFSLHFVCIQETKREDFHDYWRDCFSGRITFIWLWEPSRGITGGLLFRVIDDKYDVDTCVTNIFFTRMVLMDRQIGFNGTW
jgi:mRNA deadenylase 3'-5' endonuclease subunit Ccr4